MKIEERVKRMKTDLPAVFLALKDPATPLIAKIAAGLAVAYALSPIDLIPDFIPVLGYLDDLLIVPALTALAIHLIPPTIWQHCQAESQAQWQNGKPRKWYYAIPVVLIWILLACLILKAIFL